VIRHPSFGLVDERLIYFHLRVSSHCPGRARMIRMLRSVIRMSRGEKTFMSQLVEAHGQLEVVNGLTETTTASSKENCVTLLKLLGEAGETLNVEFADRSYRESFSTNYKLLFPSDSRNYHFDLLKACMEHHTFLYVNGEKFVLSKQTVVRTEQLQIAWKALDAVLKPWLFTSTSGSDQDTSAIEDLRVVLARLDAAWAAFESTYILELIEIEARAKSFIVKAVAEEQQLREAEICKTGVVEQRRKFVQTINLINSLANNRRKGRDDLDSSILENAIAQQGLHADKDPANSSAALMVARDVTNSFDAIRAYMRQVSKVLVRVDPHLSNNSGLVERLVDWEESWEVGLKYLRHTPMFNALGDVVEEVRKVQDAAPGFRQMCDDCDVELFLCVPRIVLLRFLAEPGECGELLKDLLPHRFLTTADQSNRSPKKERAVWMPRQEAFLPGAVSSVPASADKTLPCGPCVGDAGLEVYTVDSELKGLQDCYRRVWQQLLRLDEPSSFSGRPDLPCWAQISSPSAAAVAGAWQLLVRRVVVGTDGADELYKLLLPSSTEGVAVKTAVEGLMNELERWSLELQRHSPQDWNRCSALLLHCILGGIEKPSSAPVGKFHV